MRGRIDLEQYYQGAKTLENYLPVPHGGILRRPGGHYLANVKTAADTTIAIPFIFSLSDAYAIEAGDKYFRFIRLRGVISAGDISFTNFNGTFSDFTDWTDESPGADAASATASAGQMALEATASNNGIGELDLTTASTNSEHTLKFKITGAAVTDTVALRIGTATNLEDIYTKADFGNGYHTINFTPTTASTHIQFINDDVASTIHFVDNVSIFDNEPIELETPYAKADLTGLKWAQDADTMWLVHPSYKPMKLTRSDHEAWSLISYTPTADPFTSASNYPAAVGFFEQRIVFGYTATNPQRLFLSKSADVEDMTTGTGDADGFVKTLFATQSNPIRWIAGGTDLIIGTTGGVWVVERPASSAVTVSNFSIKRRSTSGCADISPADVDNRLLYVERYGLASNAGRNLREFKFDDSQNEFVAPDMTLLAEHLTEDSGIAAMAWQAQGWSGSYESVTLPKAGRVLWLARADGVLLSFTYSAAELVLAWARHPLAGTSATVESIAVIPGTTGDEVWMITTRTMNGATVRHIEYLDGNLFLDAGITGTSGTATKSWSGLEHLEGETVTAMVDGSPDGTFTVTGGAITINTAGTSVQIGLAYTPTVEVMPLEMALQDGTSIGTGVSVAKIIARLVKTVGLRATASGRTVGVELPFRKVSDNVEDPVAPFTGDHDITPPASWDDGTLKLEQPNPLPSFISAIVMEMEAHR